MKGTEILAGLRHFDTSRARDIAVLDALDYAINWPLVDVPLDKNGEVVVRVTSDVFALGTPEDLVRMPVGADVAQALADALGLSLITTLVSDAIWRAAKWRLAPAFMDPRKGGGRAMMGVDYLEQHDATIRHHIEQVGACFGDLVAGHKKDIVITNHALARPGYLVIYGWHDEKGSPVQPEAAPHEIAYRDYSHGLRLMHPSVCVEGTSMPLAEAVKDPAVGKLLVKNPPLAFLRYPSMSR